MTGIVANANIGMAGLILFIILFAIVLVWVFRPSMKADLKKFSEIPLKDE